MLFLLLLFEINYQSRLPSYNIATVSCICVELNIIGMRKKNTIGIGYHKPSPAQELRKSRTCHVRIHVNSWMGIRSTIHYGLLTKRSCHLPSSVAGPFRHASSLPLVLFHPFLLSHITTVYRHFLSPAVDHLLNPIPFLITAQYCIFNSYNIRLSSKANGPRCCNVNISPSFSTINQLQIVASLFSAVCRRCT